jgi:hypothetical protein
MKTRTSLLAVALLIASAVCHGQARETPESDDVVQTVSRFYKDYIKAGAGGLNWRERKEIAPAFVREIDRQSAMYKKLYGMDALDYDPVVMAQDMPSDMRFDLPAISGDTARLTAYTLWGMEGVDGESELPITITLVKSGPLWKISNIIDPRLRSVDVEFRGSSPSIKDLFCAYCESQRTAIGARSGDAEGLLEAAYQYICGGKSIRTDKGRAFDKKTVDLKNGYLSYDNGGAPPSSVEACFWNTSDKARKILAVNFAHDRPDAVHTFLLDFYRYDNALRSMTPAGEPWEATNLSQREFNERFGNTERRYVRFILPQSGKDIDVGIGGFNENGDRYDGVEQLNWSGNGFTTEESSDDAGRECDGASPTATIAECRRTREAVSRLPEVKAMKNALVFVVGLPSPAEPYYTVRVGEDVVHEEESRFVTLYWFHVFGVDDIRVYDVATDREMTLAEWRRNRRVHN